MNKKETAQIMAILQLNYPDSFKDKTDQMIMAQVNLWCDMFANDRYEDVQAAVMAHMATDIYRKMPPVGAIKTRLVELQQPDEMTELEAWALVEKAVRNGNYGAQKEFDALPPIIQRLVGSPNQLREWAQMDAKTVGTVVASNFQRSYKARAANEKEQMALPSSVKQAMEKLAGGMTMPMLGGGADG